MKISYSCALAVILAIFAANSGAVEEQSIHVISARFLDTPTRVSDEAGNSISAQGYVQLELRSQRDLIALAADRNASLWSSVTACKTKIKLASWPYLYPLSANPGAYTYVMLVSYKDDKQHAYNLAKDETELCITVGLGTMNLFRASRFSAPAYQLNQAILDSLVTYDRQNGNVKLKLSPECEAHMCIPRPTSQIQ